MNSEQHMNGKVKILGKRVYPPKLEGCSCARKPSVEFLTFHTFVRKLAGKNYRQMYGKLKRDRAFPVTAAFLKFDQYNLLPSILAPLFIKFPEYIFQGNYLPSNSHTNTVNLKPTCRSTQIAARGAILRLADSV